ncbi:hypothetical protein CV093_04630 [Oceanobacillus sp. 143]|nr:hypothetical protein CV093_04630 [Oceanobacillus sp. 143]
MNFVAHSIKLGITYDEFMLKIGSINQNANKIIMPIINFSSFTILPL